MPLKRPPPALLLIMTIIVPTSLAQTPALLPFQVDLVEVHSPGALSLQSLAAAQLNGKWLSIGGRTSGIHSFDPLPINNFPPSQANHWVWVVDPGQFSAVSVDLYDQSITPPLGLIADALSSNNTQSFQDGNTLYISGGYGYNRTTNLRLKLTPKRLLPERLGTNARIIPALNVPAFDNGMIKLHSLRGPTLVGYLYGGMRTTDANPTGTGQSFASNRLFKVVVTPIPAACIAVPAVIQ